MTSHRIWCFTLIPLLAKYKTSLVGIPGNHSCSGGVCSFSRAEEPKNASDVTSSIIVSGIALELASPPLDIIYYWDCSRSGDSFLCKNDVGLERTFNKFWSLNDHDYTDREVTEGMRCLPNDAGVQKSSNASTAYSWGFSSFLFLVYCCATLLFAIILILLQLDIYCNSGSDRSNLLHNVYSDILMLPDELREKLCHDVSYLVADHLRDMIEDLDVSFYVELERSQSPRLAAWKRRHTAKARPRKGKRKWNATRRTRSDDMVELIGVNNAVAAES